MIQLAQIHEEIELGRALLREYSEGIRVDLSFQDFELTLGQPTVMTE